MGSVQDIGRRFGMLSDAAVEYIRCSAEANVPVPRIAKDLGVDYSTVRYYISRFNMSDKVSKKTMPGILMEDDLKYIKDSVDAGIPIPEIAKNLCVSYSTVRYHAKKFREQSDKKVDRQIEKNPMVSPGSPEDTRTVANGTGVSGGIRGSSDDIAGWQDTTDTTKVAYTNLGQGIVGVGGGINSSEGDADILDTSQGDGVSVVAVACPGNPDNLAKGYNSGGIPDEPVVFSVDNVGSTDGFKADKAAGLNVKLHSTGFNLGNAVPVGVDPCSHAGRTSVKTSRKTSAFPSSGGSSRPDGSLVKGIVSDGKSMDKMRKPRRHKVNGVVDNGRCKLDGASCDHG